MPVTFSLPSARIATAIGGPPPPARRVGRGRVSGGTTSVWPAHRTPLDAANHSAAVDIPAARDAPRAVARHRVPAAQSRDDWYATSCSQTTSPKPQFTLNGDP